MVQDSLTLHRIASALRKRRFDGGALRLDNTRLFFKLDGEGNPCDYGVYEQASNNEKVPAPPDQVMLLALDRLCTQTCSRSHAMRPSHRCFDPTIIFCFPLRPANHLSACTRVPDS